MKKEILNCRQCGRPIEGKTYKSQFCSFDCYSTHRRITGEYHTGRRQCFCPLCGNVFYPLPGWNKACCSISCQKKFERRVDEMREKLQQEQLKAMQAEQLESQ